MIVEKRAIGNGQLRMGEDSREKDFWFHLAWLNFRRPFFSDYNRRYPDG
jgi:hypothetical protein